MSKKTDLSLRQQSNWWRINRNLEKVHSGERPSGFFRPQVTARTHEAGVEVVAVSKKLFGDHVSTRVTATRSEAHGHFEYVSAESTTYKHGGGDACTTERFRAHPGVVLEDKLAPKAVIKALRAAPHSPAPIPEEEAQAVVAPDQAERANAVAVDANIIDRHF